MAGLSSICCDPSIQAKVLKKLLHHRWEIVNAQPPEVIMT